MPKLISQVSLCAFTVQFSYCKLSKNAMCLFDHGLWTPTSSPSDWQLFETPRLLEHWTHDPVM